MSAPDPASQSSNNTFPVFATRNLATAAALKSLGYPCAVTVVGPSACAFQFPGSAELYAAASRVECNEPIVAPLAFNAAKTALHVEVNTLLKRRSSRGGK